MGADAAAGRHDGTPPGEDEIAARMRAEGLSPHGWGNGPADTYGWHKHGYEKVLAPHASRAARTPSNLKCIEKIGPMRKDQDAGRECARPSPVLGSLGVTVLGDHHQGFRGRRRIGRNRLAAV